MILFESFLNTDGAAAWKRLRRKRLRQTPTTPGGLLGVYANACVGGPAGEKAGGAGEIPTALGRGDAAPSAQGQVAVSPFAEAARLLGVCTIPSVKIQGAPSLLLRPPLGFWRRFSPDATAEQTGGWPAEALSSSPRHTWTPHTASP